MLVWGGAVVTTVLQLRNNSRRIRVTRTSDDRTKAHVRYGRLLLPFPRDLHVAVHPHVEDDDAVVLQHAVVAS